MSEAVVEFINFTFKYRTQVEPTLRDVSFSVKEGERVLIIGPSGSGKSTVAGCINGLIPNVYTGEMSGKVLIKGRRLEETPVFEMSKMVGTVLQDTDGQFIGLTVAEDIAFALENDCIPTPDMERRVMDVAKTVEVGELLAQAPGELSGGQKQRVSMAGVMVDNVDILLFDEPLANLDPATGQRAIRLIDSIQRDTGKTVVIIEHRLEDALTCGADRIILMSEGRILADMSPDELLCTGLLRDNGIREPLYLTAVKLAGVVPKPEDEPSSILTFKPDRYIDAVKRWYEKKPYIEEKTEGEVVLSVRDLSFSYKPDTPVIENISFDIRSGEMVAIVGKNGAGKSTLASLICGFISPEKGTIRLYGEDMAGMSVKERGEHIGLVMQNPNQMISKPMIMDEIALGLRTRGEDEEQIAEKVRNTLKTCGLYPYRNWPISALSFGQKKRVTIASILVMNPEIIILDEPTAGQDYRHYTDIMEFLKDINSKTGTTIIMITHDMHLMLEYTDRTLVISEHRLLADKAPSEVLTDDELTRRAYLKRTSLYDLAVSCGIDDTDGFVRRFIGEQNET